MTNLVTGLLVVGELTLEIDVVFFLLCTFWTTRDSADDLLTRSYWSQSVCVITPDFE